MSRGTRKVEYGSKWDTMQKPQDRLLDECYKVKCKMTTKSGMLGTSSGTRQVGCETSQVGQGIWDMSRDAGQGKQYMFNGTC